jgi:hypothetical protein
MNLRILKVKKYLFCVYYKGKLQNFGDPNPINFKETDFSKNLDLGFNLDSSAGFSNHNNNRQIITSPVLNNNNNRNKNGKKFKKIQKF